MCDIQNEWGLEEILNHPKLSDDYKFSFIEELVNEEEFCDWFETLNNLGLPIGGMGITISDLDNLDYIWDLNDDDKGIASSTTQFAEQQNFRVINLYRYISTQYGPSNIGANTRRFCKTIVSRTNAALMRYEDIVRLNSSNPGLGKGGSDTYSVFDWRGGVNCRHQWVKYKYDTDSMNLVKAPFTEQPKNIQVGNRVPYANGTNFPDKK
jgi:hypothetical protein